MSDSTWLTPAAVQSWVEDSEPAEPPDRPALQQACNAAASYVEDLHPAYLVAEPEPEAPTYEPPATIRLGAILLAARLYERRGTALGVAGFSDFGGSPILRQDPDIARLLKIGAHAPFVFGAPTVPVVEEEVLP
jgi:hypothetical protein